MILAEPLDEALRIRILVGDPGDESGRWWAVEREGQVADSQRHAGVEQFAVSVVDRLHRAARLEMIVVHEVFPADDDIEVFGQDCDETIGGLWPSGVGRLLGADRDAVVRWVGVGGHQPEQLSRPAAG